MCATEAMDLYQLTICLVGDLSLEWAQNKCPLTWNCWLPLYIFTHSCELRVIHRNVLFSLYSQISETTRTILHYQHSETHSGTNIFFLFSGSLRKREMSFPAPGHSSPSCSVQTDAKPQPNSKFPLLLSNQSHFSLMLITTKLTLFLP